MFAMRVLASMARNQKLKVFRTPAGFHDAYVAAPSRKAALEAWGSDADLFARGVAEVVTDEDLMREPLENPGKVIRRSRGTAAEQLAALPPDAPRKLKSQKRADTADADGPAPQKRASQTSSKADAKPRIDLERKPKPKPTPRPSRQKLDEAERGLADLVERQEAGEADIRERIRALEKERRALETANVRERRAVERAVEKEREEHAERLDRWIEEQGRC